MSYARLPLIREPFLDPDEFMRMADDNQVGHVIRAALVTAERFGLGARFYNRSLMLTPPSHQTRMLMTFTVRGPGLLGVETGYPEPAPRDALLEFYGVSRSQSERVLGRLGHHDCGPDEAIRLLRGLETLITPR